MKSGFLKNCLALLAITLVAGFALSAVNEITKEPIALAEEKARSEAYQTVFAVVQFDTVEDAEALMMRFQAENTYCSVDDVLEAKDKNGNSIGYVMSATSPSGYGGDIRIAVGISSVTEEITGFSVLANSETAGLGAKCTEDFFTSQFAGKSAHGISYTKTGASDNTQIDAISGATVTTNAVTEAVNCALDFYNKMLKEG